MIETRRLKNVVIFIQKINCVQDITPINTLNCVQSATDNLDNLEERDNASLVNLITNRHPTLVSF